MNSPENETFEISAVSKLTGLSSHVLRVWERRYSVVDPLRTDSGRRRYTQADIQRLALLKTLVDNGNSIGSIAGLTSEQLDERLSAVLNARVESDDLEEAAADGVCRIAFSGTKARQSVREACDSVSSLRGVGEFSSLEELESSLRPGSADLLIVEHDTLFPNDIERIRRLTTTLGIRRAVVIYFYAGETALEPLDIKQITLLRGPVTASEIQLACITDIQLALRSGTPPESVQGVDSEAIRERTLPGEIPERIFDDEQLVKLANLSAVVKCECPQHLAGLLSTLFAFEKYSEQCEDRNADDAELHAYLHRTTAKCRSQMEIALSEVLTQEGISV